MVHKILTNLRVKFDENDGEDHESQIRMGDNRSRSGEMTTENQASVDITKRDNFYLPLGLYTFIKNIEVNERNNYLKKLGLWPCEGGV